MILLADVRIPCIAMGTPDAFRIMEHSKYFYIDYTTCVVTRTHLFPTSFQVKDGKLFHNNYHVIWFCDPPENKTTLMITNNPNPSNFVEVEFEEFDLRTPKYKGAYAHVFSPSVTGDQDMITRLCIDDGVYEPTDEVREKLDFCCVFPVSSKKVAGHLICELKKCINNHDFKEYFKEMNVFDLLVRFRNLFVGLRVMNSIQFFHSDIKTNNIVIDNGIFKFIDFDLSFQIPNIKKQVTLFGNSELHSIFPTLPNMFILSHFMGLEYDDILGHNNEDFHTYQAFLNHTKYENVRNVLIANSYPRANKKKIFLMNKDTLTHGQHLQMFMYISVYQLCIALLCILRNFETKMYDDVIIPFFMKIFDFENNGIMSIDATIRCYDQLIRDIKKCDGLLPIPLMFEEPNV